MNTSILLLSPFVVDAINACVKAGHRVYISSGGTGGMFNDQPMWIVTFEITIGTKRGVYPLGKYSVRIWRDGERSAVQYHPQGGYENRFQMLPSMEACIEQAQIECAYDLRKDRVAEVDAEEISSENHDHGPDGP